MHEDVVLWLPIGEQAEGEGWQRDNERPGREQRHEAYRREQLDQKRQAISQFWPGQVSPDRFGSALQQPQVAAGVNWQTVIRAAQQREDDKRMDDEPCASDRE